LSNPEYFDRKIARQRGVQKMSVAKPGTGIDYEALLIRYQQVRSFTEELCRPLAIEDHVVQSMPDASPTKWHLAHTSWFFETFVLRQFYPGYSEFDSRYCYLFNSYYVSIGERHCRPKRGLLSRPTVEEVRSYRKHVDQHVLRLKDRLSSSADLNHLAALLEIGLHHEQQHQELILTDIKHAFAINPLRPCYSEPKPSSDHGTGAPVLEWRDHDAGVYEIGHGGQSFAYDNETPRHRVFVESFQLASRLVTNGEYLAFIEDGGYKRPQLWLSDGWNVAQQQGWEAPLYWEKKDGRWYIWTLAGLRPVDEHEPVCHVSYYESDAYARWAGARLPTEAEWEIAAAALPIEGNFVESGNLHPVPAPNRGAGPVQMFGDVWEWTQSGYLPYPGYRPVAGPLGEYNAKFMCNQFVLRGGSCATSVTHIRPTYRNFFPPEARWQFTGIRLAK
jgi:ergothioneine biosynthesis protein EgtB